MPRPLRLATGVGGRAVASDEEGTLDRFANVYKGGEMFCLQFSNCAILCPSSPRGVLRGEAALHFRRQTVKLKIAALRAASPRGGSLLPLSFACHFPAKLPPFEQV